MNSLFNLNGKVALITGSSRGIGFFIARGMGEAGAKVVLNGRNEKILKDAITEFNSLDLNNSGAGYPFDVTDRESIDKQITLIEHEVGPVDILVNNAGIQGRSPLEAVNETLWRDIFETNLNGVLFVTQRIVQSMIERKKGKIINICSLMSEVTRPTVGPYSASKGALKMLTKSMAAEWAKYGIQVNGIGPGYFKTDLNANLISDPAFDRWIKERTPAGRWGNMEELIGPAVFLASEASSFVNGQILYVDGGVLSVL